MGLTIHYQCNVTLIIFNKELWWPVLMKRFFKSHLSAVDCLLDRQGNTSIILHYLTVQKHKNDFFRFQQISKSINTIKVFCILNLNVSRYAIRIYWFMITWTNSLFNSIRELARRKIWLKLFCKRKVQVNAISLQITTGIETIYV